MPELPELTVVQEVLHRRIIGQTIVSAEIIPPGGPSVVDNLTGAALGQVLAGAQFESVACRGKSMTFVLSRISCTPRRAGMIAR